MPFMLMLLGTAVTGEVLRWRLTTGVADPIPGVYTVQVTTRTGTLPPVTIEDPPLASENVTGEISADGHEDITGLRVGGEGWDVSSAQLSVYFGVWEDLRAADDHPALEEKGQWWRAHALVSRHEIKDSEFEEEHHSDSVEQRVISYPEGGWGVFALGTFGHRLWYDDFSKLDDTEVHTQILSPPGGEHHGSHHPEAALSSAVVTEETAVVAWTVAGEIFVSYVVTGTTQKFPPKRVALGVTDYAVDVAVAATGAGDGSFVVAWCARGGGITAMQARYRWGEILLFPEEKYSLSGRSVSAVRLAGSQGFALVSDVEVKLYTPSGTQETAAAAYGGVSRAGGKASAAPLPGGGLLVVWDSSSDASARVVHPDGTMGEAVAVHPGTTRAVRPRAAALSDGRVVVVCGSGELYFLRATRGVIEVTGAEVVAGVHGEMAVAPLPNNGFVVTHAEWSPSSQATVVWGERYASMPDQLWVSVRTHPESFGPWGAAFPVRHRLTSGYPIVYDTTVVPRNGGAAWPLPHTVSPAMLWSVSVLKPASGGDRWTISSSNVSLRVGGQWTPLVVADRPPYPFHTIDTEPGYDSLLLLRA